MSLSDQALSSIGKLLVYVQEQILPHTPFPKAFSRKSDYEEKYIRMFANQLKITNEDDIKKFGFHAITILINNDLNPHCDSMNPSSEDEDYTLSLSVQVPISDIPRDVQGEAMRKYGTSVPLCIVLYKRKCLTDYCKRMTNLNQFKDLYPKKKEGRQKLIDLLSSTYSDTDYVGNFFEKQRWTQKKHSFKVEKGGSVFHAPILVTKEAVDKMAYWSCLLHMYYLYVFKNGLQDIESSFSFVIFLLINVMEP